MIDLNKVDVFDSPVDCWVRNDVYDKWEKRKLVAILPECITDRYIVQIGEHDFYAHMQCTLTDPYAPKKRLPTQEELMAFAITHSSTHQVRFYNNGEWNATTTYTYSEKTEHYRFRTVEWNNGKPVYGEPFQLWIEVEAIDMERNKN